jgi:quinoprotein relay system zinc metallohydrolase 2
MMKALDARPARRCNTQEFLEMLVDRRAWLKASLAAATLPALRVVPVAAAAASVVEIAPGVFVHRGRHELFSSSNQGDISNPGFVVGTDGVAVVDTGGSPVVGRQLKEAIAAVTKVPVRYVINTHMHPDHVFGNAAFEGDGVAFVGHHKLARGLAARADRYLAINKDLLGPDAFAGTRIIVPSLTVETTRTLDLGGRTITLTAQPTAHTDNDLTIADSATGTVFMGDLLFVEHVPTIDGSIKGWIALLDRFSAAPPVRVVPGHGPHALAWPAAADPIRRYLKTVADDVRTLIKQGKTLAEATEAAGLSEKDAWLLFEEYHKRNVSAAFAELEWE